ncbi:uncharacterized protein BDR25DRAFT_361789 [Lindgomyces ingoldianus]|uniref:Uncharacterized protein n=1 Tax=Lindgomyces ingoldianus TaxID=673940 RepID=A0ACB6QDT6_9PLEO|nr:uncharacterized protein BDR25DRAFT_361789 [Lindgomyces ingoldianus]KAF2464287.1 hypothetical protein BDR25DRAFT_361789 [Lindgomyces ingoldianus]
MKVYDLQLETINGDPSYTAISNPKTYWSSIVIKLGDFELSQFFETQEPWYLWKFWWTPLYWLPEQTFTESEGTPEGDVWAIDNYINTHEPLSLSGHINGMKFYWEAITPRKAYAINCSDDEHEPYTHTLNDYRISALKPRTLSNSRSLRRQIEDAYTKMVEANKDQWDQENEDLELAIYGWVVHDPTGSDVCFLWDDTKPKRTSSSLFVELGLEVIPTVTPYPDKHINFKFGVLIVRSMSLSPLWGLIGQTTSFMQAEQVQFDRLKRSPQHFYATAGLPVVRGIIWCETALHRDVIDSRRINIFGPLDEVCHETLFAPTPLAINSVAQGLGAPKRFTATLRGLSKVVCSVCTWSLKGKSAILEPCSPNNSPSSTYTTAKCLKPSADLNEIHKALLPALHCGPEWNSKRPKQNITTTRNRTIKLKKIWQENNAVLLIRQVTTLPSSGETHLSTKEITIDNFENNSTQRKGRNAEFLDIILGGTVSGSACHLLPRPTSYDKAGVRFATSGYGSSSTCSDDAVLLVIDSPPKPPPKPAQHDTPLHSKATQHRRAHTLNGSTDDNIATTQTHSRPRQFGISTAPPKRTPTTLVQNAAA